MIQRGYRALVLWIVWSAAAIIIYLSLYQSTDLLAFVRVDPSRITWVILGLFVAGVLTSLFLTIMITLESVKVDHLETIARTLGWPGIQAEEKKHVVGEFFDSLKTVVANNGDLAIEALVEVEFAIYQRTAHTVEIIGNMLITLGLIGTVVGLTLTLTGLTGSLEALGHDQEQLLRGLRQAMGGMGTAFYTTLLGSVLGGILLRIYAHIDEHGIESLEKALTRICLVHCSADFRPSVQRDVRVLNSEIAALTRNIQQLQDALDDSRGVIRAFGSELAELRRNEGEDALLEKTLALRGRHLDNLRTEFQLKRLNRGAWWRAFLGGFRRR